MKKIKEFFRKIQEKIRNRRKVLYFTFVRNDCIQMKKCLDMLVRRFDDPRNYNDTFQIMLFQSAKYSVVIRLSKAIERQRGTIQNGK